MPEPGDPNLTAESVREALNLFADTTGGRITYTMNDPSEALRTTALDQRAIYSVGFYAVAAPDNRVERASLNRTSTGPKALAPYARRWMLKPETRAVRVVVRDWFTGRYGTLDIPTNPTNP